MRHVRCPPRRSPRLCRRANRPRRHMEPALVRCTLLDTIRYDTMRWAKATAGCTGGRGFARIAGLTWTPDLQERLAEGWGIADAPDPEDQRRPAPAFGRSQITVFTAALHWQTKYLVAEDRVGSSRMLGLWLRGRVQWREHRRDAGPNRRQQGPLLSSPGPRAFANRHRSPCRLLPRSAASDAVMSEYF